MQALRHLLRTGSALALATTLSLCPLAQANAQTASFVAANSSISGEVSQLSHVLMIQIPRPVILDIGAQEKTTLTVPSLSDIIINGETIAPAQTPVLISIEPADGTKGARVKAKAIMLKGKLIALEADGDFIPSFVVGKKDYNERVKSSMNLAAAIGNGVAGTLGTGILGKVGAGMGDNTGANLANQMISGAGLIGIGLGMLGGGGGKRIIDLQPNSIHVLTLRNPAIVVAQAIQLNREIAAGNAQSSQAIAGQLQSTSNTQAMGGSALAGNNLLSQN